MILKDDHIIHSEPGEMLLMNSLSYLVGPLGENAEYVSPMNGVQARIVPGEKPRPTAPASLLLSDGQKDVYISTDIWRLRMFHAELGQFLEMLDNPEFHPPVGDD